MPKIALFANLFMLLSTIAPLAARHPDQTVGAIRWDAWYGDGTGVNGEVEKTLSPRRWQWRAPFFAKSTSPDKIQIRGGPEDMQKEIDFAADAGLDYWAFCIYEKDHNLSRALQLYLAAPNRHKINFCLNLQGQHIALDGIDKALQRMDIYVDYMHRPEYQTVLHGRPLVYIFQIQLAVAYNGLKDENEVKLIIDKLRQKAIKSGLLDPYIVFQEQSPDVYELKKKFNGDAISHYAANTGRPNQSYEQLKEYTENIFWAEYLATGAEMVPLATTGFDTRPRIQTPVSWSPELATKSMDIFHAQPKLSVMASHIRNALEFLCQHPAQTPAQTVLIYAWNEFDEGGWLCPTLGEGTSRIEFLRDVLKPPVSDQ